VLLQSLSGEEILLIFDAQIHHSVCSIVEFEMITLLITVHGQIKAFFLRCKPLQNN
jgi:hypothetical protein